jgi:uncharacterized protein YnzC (UPF0291/DUF896 family)
MTHITIEISQPVNQYLIQQAQKVNSSPDDWLQAHLSEAFGIALPTAEKAKERGESALREHSSTTLCIGTPTFDETTFQWHLLVLPNLRSGHLTPVGELCFDAKTGELRTSPGQIYDMSEKAKRFIGIQHLPQEIEKRMEQLSNRADTQGLTPSEQKELDELAEQWLNHALKNSHRLVANVNRLSSSESTS